MTIRESAEVRIWDPFVRAAHWTIVVGFFVAYLTEDDLLTVHVWAGYIVGALVLLRVVWGFIGPRHARFAEFVYGPSMVFTYLWGLIRFSAKRYLGHSPAGGAMVVALLLLLAATVASGLIEYAADRGAGPLAPFYAQGASTISAAPAKVANSDKKESKERESALKEIHETLANVTLALVIVHILGVVLASFVHHENLVRSMITGRKRPE